MSSCLDDLDMKAYGTFTDPDFNMLSDNSQLLEIFEKKSGGVWSLLSEQCNLPRGGPAKLLEGLSKYNKKSPHAYAFNPRPGKETFKVKHTQFSAVATYQAHTFLYSNKGDCQPGVKI